MSQHSQQQKRSSQDQNLDTSVSEKSGFFGSSSLRAFALVLLGGLAGGLAGKVADSEAESLTRINSLDARIATLDNSNAELMNQLREALQLQQESGRNMDQVNSLLGQLLQNERSSAERLGASEDQLAALKQELERSNREADLADAGISSRIRELTGDLEQLREATHEPSDQELWDNLVRPTVLLQSARTSGSGVLLRSQPAASGFETLLLTAQHVVEGIRMDWKNKSVAEPIQIQMYDDGGKMLTLQAELVSEDKSSDLALLRILSDQALTKGVKLPERIGLADKLDVFSDVYAVGGPLGIDPVPSKGEITDADHPVMGQRRILMSAPTIPGNSGGPIMDAETFELLGISSMVYTVPGTIGRSPVPHMGIIVPIDEIYKWLETIGRAELIPGFEAQIAQASPTK